MNVVTDLSQRYDLDDQTTLIDQHAGGCMPVKIMKPTTTDNDPSTESLSPPDSSLSSLSTSSFFVEEPDYETTTEMHMDDNDNDNHNKKSRRFHFYHVLLCKRTKKYKKRYCKQGK